MIAHRKFLNKRNLIIAALFVVFLFLRLFVDSSSVLLAADHLKYLETSKNFPYHKLYNDQLYLFHPPFYPYTIHLFTLIFQEDTIAAVLLSLISAIVTFFVLYKFFMMLTNFNITFFVLVFYTLSVAFINSATAILRESFVVMLILLSIYYYVKGIKFNEKKPLIIATIIGSFLALASDHVVFLFPAFILSYIFFNSKKINLKKLNFPNLKYIAIPIIILFIFYSSWNAVKFYQYSTNEYYTNGVEGTPLSTHDLGLMQLISPHYFEDFSGPYISPGLLSFPKKLAFQFGYMFNIEPFSIPLGLNFSTMSYLLFPRHVAYMFLIYLPLALIALFGFFTIIKDFIKTRRIYNNVNLYMMGLFFIFLIPITQQFVSPRYIYTSYIFLFYFISFGIYALFMKKESLQNYSKLLVIVILLFLLIPFWFIYNGNFVLFNKNAFGAHNTADFINNNLDKGDAIMAQPGYSVQLNYLTEQRTLGLYPKPEKLPYLIDYYNASYIVFGKRYTYDVAHFSIDTVEYVKSNPDKFELIASVQEDYSDFYVEEDLASADEVYIYKIKK
tara:strand:+ start:3719 stop:5389 length:1671 start_codon:yes stop_codon:yes gene_type:complete